MKNYFINDVLIKFRLYIELIIIKNVKDANLKIY